MSKALVATDGSSFAIAAAKAGLGLLNPGCDVAVISVASHAVVPVGPAAALSPAGAPLAMVTDHEGQETADRSAMASARATIEAITAALGISARPLIEHGDPGEAICAAAERDGFDVIVVGSHGSGFLRRALVGSVSHHVLHHATCPVLVVPAEGRHDAHR